MFVNNHLLTPGSDAVQNVMDVVPGMDFQPGLRRPYFDKYDRPSVTINTGRWTIEKGVRRPIKEHVLISNLVDRGVYSPVFNATSLRKEEWLELDRNVVEAARYRLTAWSDLESAPGAYGGFDGMSTMILEHETMADPGEAIVDMNGITEGRNDAPKYQLEGLPLPITHCDFWMDLRKLSISRKGGKPIDLTMGNSAAARVGEAIEKTTIGNQIGVTYGGNSTQVGGYGRTSAVYGYVNFGPRLTKTNLTTPTGSNPETTVAEVLAMKDQLTARKQFGPWMLYHSSDWDQYMDNDYARLGGNNATMTLRERLRKIDGVQDVKRLDMLFATVPQTNQYWTSSTIGTTGQQVYTGPGGENIGTPGATAHPFTLLMVSLNPNTARAVTGMPIQTLQWESKGGMQLNFKVMTIKVPQLRADFYGNCGILQATTGAYALA